MKRGTMQQGQAMVEYMIICAALVAALFVPLNSGQNTAQYLATAIRNFFQALTYFISLP